MKPDAALLPPKREPGEDAESYIERLEWHRAQIPADVLEAPIRGHVAGSGGLVHHSRADYRGRSGSGPEGMRENPNVFRAPTTVYFKPLPPIRKRTPAERVEEVQTGLTALALMSYQGGVMRLPCSIAQKLVRLGLYPDEVAVARASVEDVVQAFNAYAVDLLERVQVPSLLEVSSKPAPGAEPPATTQEGTAPAIAVPAQKG